MQTWTNEGRHLWQIGRLDVLVHQVLVDFVGCFERVATRVASVHLHTLSHRSFGVEVAEVRPGVATALIL